MSIVSIGALVFGLLLPQAQPSQDELKDLLNKKLAKQWLKDGGWTTDYDKARKLSKKSGKPILVYFTRSYEP